MAADKLSFFLSEWEKCDPEGYAQRANRKETVLETIARVRLADVATAAAALPLADLKAKVEVRRLASSQPGESLPHTPTTINPSLRGS